MIIVLSLISAYSVFLIKVDTQNILKANYNTLEYSRNMLLSLENKAIDERVSIAVFEENLNKQMANSTEIGETAANNNLRKKFTELRNDWGSEIVKNQIRQNIFEIMKLNMNAIKLKSDVATHTAQTANLWIAVSGTLCFLIAFNLLVNLPSNIANPIRELTQSIKEIANKNYLERVHFMNHNEFGDLAKSFNSMAEKLQEYSSGSLHKLAFEKKRLETLINNMHDPIIGLDEKRVILFVNDEALKIIGLKAQDVVGQLATTLALTNDLLKSLIVSSFQDDKQKMQSMKIFADGIESYFEKEVININVKPTGEDAAINIGDVIILRNITVFKELDFAKTNFIATVSHELKTPISSIKMSLQLLEKEETGSINEDQKQLISSIKEDSERLLKITGELLDLSQVETGKLHLTIENNSPYEILNYAVAAVKMQAEQKGIEININAEENLPLVKADSEKTSWVLINFLTNAITYYSENSKISVTIKTEKSTIIFEVMDKGKGIDSHYKNKVFDKYFQIPGSHKLGTGLGLAISKEFIEAQNGIIGVKSELGLGSTFSIQLNAVS